jgi:hypothetical protein
VRASFLSGVSPLPGSRSRLSMYAAPDMGPFSGACAAGFFSLGEKSSLEKNLGPFCCHKNTSFILTCLLGVLCGLYPVGYPRILWVTTQTQLFLF